MPVEAPLEGTLIIIRNDDRPGVIGAVGTVLGRHGVNIANFALGRGSDAGRSASSALDCRRAMRQQAMRGSCARPLRRNPGRHVRRN